MENNRNVPSPADAQAQSPSPQQAAQAPAPRVYTPNAKYLVLIALALGVFFERACLFYNGPYDSRIAFSLFFFLCAASVAALNFAAFKKRRTAQATFAAATVLCLLHAFHPNAYSLSLGLYDLIAVPALCMLTAVLTVSDYPLKREGAIAGSFLRAWTVGAFSCVPRFFGAIAAAFKGSGKGAYKSVLLGLALAVPVVAAVLLLLSNADQAMAGLVSGLFGRLDVGELLGRCFFALVTAMLVYSAVYALTFQAQKPLAPYRDGALAPVTFSIALVALILVYAVFGYLQFSYLFGGRLPAEYTYSEYARQGFSELILVSIINFTLFGTALRYSAGGKAQTALLSFLLAATALLLASAITRLLLYIGAYRLTFNRILPLWLMIYLSFLVVLCAVRLVKKNTPLLRIAAWGLIVWYLVLYLPGWQAIITSYNAL